jgi:hypothetical protein
LRPVLEVPAAARVDGVVAADEGAQRRVADAGEGAAGSLPQQPVAAPVERQPALDRRHLRPARHRAQHGGIHGGAPFTAP